MNLHIVIHVKDAEQAVEMARVAVKNGVNRLFVISHLGEDVTLPDIARQIKAECPTVSVGLNCLGADFAEAFGFAAMANADALWFDDAGFHSSQPDQAKKSRFLVALNQFKILHPHVDVFVGVGFKYQRVDAQPEIAALEVLSAGCIPTTSGSATGVAADPTQIRLLCQGLPKASRIALASGVSAENIEQWRDLITDVFVASSVSDNEYTLNPGKVAKLNSLCQQ